MDEHLWIVAYDIADQKRWRKVFDLLHGYGDWLQLSVFQCRLSRKRQVQLLGKLSRRINHKEDHVVLLDLGPADSVKPRIRSLGKEFKPVERSPIIV